MNRSLPLCLCLAALKDSFAWGPLFEPLKGGLFGRFIRADTFLKASSETDDRRDFDRLGDRSARSFRADLERTFALHDSTNRQGHQASSQDYISLDSSLLDELVGYHDVTYEPSFALPSEIFCKGDGCDSDEHDCLIPDEFKVLSDDAANEVLSYLGIRRAEPIRVDQQMRIWE
jgi:hypothetical protein